MTSPSPLLTSMSVDAHNLHLSGPQIMMDRMVMDTYQATFAVADASFVTPTSFTGDGGLSWTSYIDSKKSSVYSDGGFSGSSIVIGNKTSFAGALNIVGKRDDVFTGASNIVQQRTGYCDDWLSTNLNTVGKPASLHSNGGVAGVSNTAATKNVLHNDAGFIGSSNLSGKKRVKETPVFFLGEASSAQFRQNFLPDHLLRQTQQQQVKTDLAERRRLFCQQVAETIEYETQKRLKVMDDEIEAATKLNWLLEERVGSLAVETQIFKEFAQSSEVAMILLRADLHHIITNQASTNKNHEQCIADDVDDSESCCGDNEYSENKATPTQPSTPVRICRRCRRKEPTVLLLPCRHLCICAACGPTTSSCPVCNCLTTGTVNVNLS